MIWVLGRHIYRGRQSGFEIENAKPDAGWRQAEAVEEIK
jgi:hypothetical protein